jgi:hypothetical protein
LRVQAGRAQAPTCPTCRVAVDPGALIRCLVAEQVGRGRLINAYLAQTVFSVPEYSRGYYYICRSLMDRVCVQSSHALPVEGLDS